MRAQLTLQIEVRFSDAARSANQLLRLTPRAFDGLHVLDWFVGVEPVATLRRGEDGFGNIVHSCSHAGPLDKILITAEGLVETQDAAGVTRGLHEKQPLDVFLRHHESPGDIAAYAAQALDGETDRLTGLHRLMAALHEKLRFAPADVPPRPAAEVFAAGEGSARELAQVFVAAARAEEIPARFVSGLRLDGGEGAPIHAWAEAYVDGLGWIGFDSALGFCPRDAHLRLGHGVDFFSAAPRRGAFFGYADEKVETRLAISSARQASWQIQQ
ncbi:Transglutaminase-like enzyme, putative cysteine protease [Rhodoblastus acidophilus]|uniref:Transglutaminase-like enzyme, putative cysteine protease n=1 Tax=Rhodoblastus acidophilus TaxID=1074 RepID=A0A212S5S9_RHOAC|nr:transglutaminase family protein [Rhodoblastus acidophilus]PPQ37485.1 transglutaminase family protein [Rhodoblastus acidophilus]RAI19697.1 transglutaminase family protein [Rhodoblastus acidophilus]SNB80582.1 Transglutaminase-like enzyme, putative cysteine protease [Rhodoblastus acidophilus]